MEFRDRQGLWSVQDLITELLRKKPNIDSLPFLSFPTGSAFISLPSKLKVQEALQMNLPGASMSVTAVTAVSRNL